LLAGERCHGLYVADASRGRSATRGGELGVSREMEGEDGAGPRVK